MQPRAYCVHGHFYQPPREDPLTGEIPVEPGAAPYRNWNERIHAECYRPNAELGNFGRMSFNVGPTLFNWMRDYDSLTYARIIEQDRQNYQHHGVGNALAQAYNHTILPLATRADKVTQVRWGIADFENRFGHRPAGLWLPETASDTETLSVLAEHNIEFTILAPWQAAASIDPREPYLVHLPEGRSITVFFYDQDLSTRISFDPASTTNADAFVVNHLIHKFRPEARNDAPQFVMAASDGELYGHHQPFRDKFLSHLLNGALTGREIQFTYPGLWLRQHPARAAVEILDNTSWSCHHGVARWMGECGCTLNSAWKGPLRQGLNQLAAQMDAVYLEAVKPFGLNDPWELRHQYVYVILGETGLEDLFGSITGRRLAEDELKRMQLLMQAQFERQRIFTSCGWFFEDFDRIEPRNNVSYAAQAVWLTFQATGVDLTNAALVLLKKVRSQRSGLRADEVFMEKIRCLREADSGTSPTECEEAYNASNNLSI